MFNRIKAPQTAGYASKKAEGNSKWTNSLKVSFQTAKRPFQIQLLIVIVYQETGVFVGWWFCQFTISKGRKTPRTHARRQLLGTVAMTRLQVMEVTGTSCGIRLFLRMLLSFLNSYNVLFFQWLVWSRLVVPSIILKIGFLVTCCCYFWTIM